MVAVDRYDVVDGSTKYTSENVTLFPLLGTAELKPQHFAV